MSLVHNILIIIIQLFINICTAWDVSTDSINYAYLGYDVNSWTAWSSRKFDIGK